MILGFLSGVFWALDTIFLSKSNFHIFFIVMLHDLFGIFVTIGLLKKISIKKEQLLLCLLGAVFGSIGMYSFAINVVLGFANLAGVLSGLYPIVSVFLARVFLSKRLSKTATCAIVLSSLCACFVFLYSSNVLYYSIFSIALGIVCAFSWGAECLVVDTLLKRGINEREILFIKQSVSIIIGIILILINFTYLDSVNFLKIDLLYLVIAALLGSMSYLFYYKSIAKIGVLKAVGLNISYCAWIVIFGMFVGGSFDFVLFFSALFIMSCSVMVLV